MPSYSQYKRQLVVLDADDIESWITVRGNHIPIKKGQSKEEVVKSFLKNKGSSWSKRANKPETLGKAAKNATKTAMSLNKKAKKEANYTALEIAYNDVNFAKSPKQNKADMLKAVSKSGAKNIDYMKQTITNMPETAFESHNSFRKGLKDTTKWHADWSKHSNKPVTIGEASKKAVKIVEQKKKTKENLK